MSTWDEIRFDMSREGLQELECCLTEFRHTLSGEVLNFHNQILSLLDRVAATKTEESAWLDE